MARSNPSESRNKIGEAERALLRKQGPAALRWQQEFGSAKAQQICAGLVISGFVPFVGRFANHSARFLASDVPSISGCDKASGRSRHSASRGICTSLCFGRVSIGCTNTAARMIATPA